MKLNDRSKFVLGAALCAVVAGCSSSHPTTTPSNSATAAKNAGNFTTTVFLGDSLTAGFQNGSLLDTQQVHGWAPLVATQAGFTIVQPLISSPGAPAVLQLKALGPPPVIVQVSGTTMGRDNPTTQPTDLAVPGALLTDVLNTKPTPLPTTGQQQITELVLGFPGIVEVNAQSQAGYAAQAKPTTIFLWIGNNDVLVADETGMPASMTSTANFTAQYTALIQYLTSNTTAHLVIGNIPDVTAVPYLTPAALVLGEFSAGTGVPVATLSALLGIQPGDLVNPTGLAEIANILGGKQKGPIDDAGVLSAAEVTAVQAQVAADNAVIVQQAQAAGATLVDINALFAGTTANGLTINGVKGTTAFLGGFFGLDGIHPTNTGYAVIANTFIDTMNTAFGKTIPDVDLSAVAAADPFWPPNIKVQGSVSRPMMIPANAGKALDPILVKGGAGAR